MISAREVLFHRLSIRIIYIAAAYSTSHLVALVASPKVTALMASIGAQITITDPMMFKTKITMALLFLGEVAFHFWDKNFGSKNEKDKAPQSEPVTPLPGVTSSSK